MKNTEVEEMLRKAAVLSSETDGIGLLIGPLIWGIASLLIAFAFGVRPTLIFLEMNYPYRFLVFVALPSVFTCVLVQMVYAHICKFGRTRFAKDLEKRCESAEFVESLKTEVTCALQERKKVYKIAGTRTVTATGTEDKLVVGQDLVAPEHSEREGKLAHLYRVLPENSRVALARKVPEIQDLRISSVLSPSPGDPFDQKEIR